MEIRVDIEKMRSIPPIDRFYFLLKTIKENDSCFLEASEKMRKYLGEMESPYSDNEKYVRYSDIVETYKRTIVEEVLLVFEIIVDFYSLNDVNTLSGSSISIINNEVFPLSVMLIPFERWKSIVKYELEILGDKKKIKIALRRFKAMLKDLRYRINGDFIPQIGVYRLEFYEGNYSFNYNMSRPPFKMSDFDQPLNKYLTYLNEIDVEGTFNASLKRTLMKIQKDEDLKLHFKSMQVFISDDFPQKKLLRLSEAYFKKYLTKIDAYAFVVHVFRYKKKVPESYYLKKDRGFNSYNLSNEELLDLISFFKFLKEKNIVNSSIRSLARSIKYFYKVGKGEETIRKKLVQKSKVNLPDSIKKDLNYYLF